MDIDLLSKMVKELILDNDKVVLPGLGCFTAEIIPASFSDKGYTINPPYRRLSFRSMPDEGHLLAAPKKGAMTRYIKENIVVKSKYEFSYKNEIILSAEDEFSSSEWMWND